jgi:hypothetical protein
MEKESREMKLGGNEIIKRIEGNETGGKRNNKSRLQNE